jgi:hypothetical protein
MNIFTRIYNYWNRISASASDLFFGFRLMYRVCTSDNLLFALHEGPYFALGTKKKRSRMTPVYICSDEEMTEFMDLFQDFSFDSLTRLEVDGLDSRADESRAGVMAKILQYFVLNRQARLEALSIEHCGCSNSRNKLVSTPLLAKAFSRVNELTLDFRRRNNYDGPDLQFQEQCLAAMASTTNLVKLTLRNVASIDSQLIANALVSNGTLQEFSFCGSFSDSHYLSTIIPTIRDHKTLHTLDYTDRHRYRYSSHATRDILNILWDNDVLKDMSVNCNTWHTNPTISCLVDRNKLQCKRILKTVAGEILWPKILHKADQINTSLLFMLLKEKPELFGDCKKRHGEELDARPSKRPRSAESGSVEAIPLTTPAYIKWRNMFRAAVIGSFVQGSIYRGNGVPNEAL